MHRRTTRGNRIGLGLLGLLLALGGAALIVAHLGGFGRAVTDSKLYPPTASGWITDHRWIFWVIAVAASIVALIALRWILLQFRTDRIRTAVVDTEAGFETGSGRTSLVAPAIASAIRAEAEAIIGVRRAAVTLSGARDAPELWLEVSVDENSDTGSIRAALIGTVLADARAALEQPAMPAYLTLRVSNRSSPRQVA